MSDENKDSFRKIVEEANRASEQMKKLQESFKPIKIPNFSVPAMPTIRHRNISLPKIPSQAEVNHYQSAGVFMKAIADEALAWEKQLPEEYVPAILAVLYGGIQVQVHSLFQVSFHGIRIEGEMNGGPCSILAHQSTVQILCYGAVKEEPRRPIGFHWDDSDVEV